MTESSPRPKAPPLKNRELADADQFKILITCRDEAQQLELLERFEREGVKCKALVA